MSNLFDTHQSSNKCIACSVTSCAHHSKTEDYCELDKIKVGSPEKHPGDAKCTECDSFMLDCNKKH